MDFTRKNVTSPPEKPFFAPNVIDKQVPVQGAGVGAVTMAWIGAGAVTMAWIGMKTSTPHAVT